MDIKRQMSLEDTSDEYRQFVDKFRPRKTTDDCYTPQPVYDAIAQWVADEYHLDRARFVRPFYPGGDYIRYPYTEDCVVVDNPPFSIISAICRFYLDNKIRFFLFAPYLTNFNVWGGMCHVVTECDIIYDNGARVKTAFLTNLEQTLIRSAPTLNALVKQTMDRIRIESKKELPKYEYPDEVLMGTNVGMYSKYGIEFKVMPEDAIFIRALDAQRKAGKSLFGGGYLLSDQATADRIAADRAVAQHMQVIRWELSERERKLQQMIGPDTGGDVNEDG